MISKNQFKDDGAQSYSVFWPVHKHFKTLTNKNIVIAWIKVLSEKKIKPPARSNNSLNPGLDYIYNVKIWVKFDGSCLKQEKITLNDKTLLNFYIIKYMAF